MSLFYRCLSRSSSARADGWNGRPRWTPGPIAERLRGGRARRRQWLKARASPTLPRRGVASVRRFALLHAQGQRGTAMSLHRHAAVVKGQQRRSHALGKPEGRPRGLFELRGFFGRRGHDAEMEIVVQGSKLPRDRCAADVRPTCDPSRRRWAPIHLVQNGTGLPRNQIGARRRPPVARRSCAASAFFLRSWPSADLALVIATGGAAARAWLVTCAPVDEGTRRAARQDFDKTLRTNRKPVPAVLRLSCRLSPGSEGNAARASRRPLRACGSSLRVATA